MNKVGDIGQSGAGIIRFLPNLITALALCAGLISIRFSVDQQFDLALSAIVISALLDGLDGRIARKFSVSSRFGAEFDSLADFLSFGVAPVVLLFFWAEDDMSALLSICLTVFVIASATRLARFNVESGNPGAPWRKAYFTGLPTPSAALAVLLPVSIAAPSEASIQWVTAYTLLVALLMVSTVPTFSGKTTGLAASRAARTMLLAMAGAAMIGIFLYPRQVLIAFTVAYLATIPLSWLSFCHQRRLHGDA
ncbi:CDP-diacylglycerol--serine O-phosphatidyltransferase [Mesorhizobium soli]|uniref:CDP-diacylglycerol--serine O-phosphatidyltransferase n=1 Tax=Pseudaminobacter soli (ex Li et al. 2025) TaxID=1295366 RepID=UPI0024769470|nr:CDP-diacylglycerol--serine O-phosphatidyltransferase [Mesorhizobium soli]MDH6232828.1 CDP-diacylglycerol--serine O-phosphatidyltransferase [Mesorhizobium soli]